MNFSFCIRKLAVAFYMINEIQPKITFQNIVQCPFNRNSCSLIMQVNLGSIDHDLGIGVIEGLTVVTESNMYNVQVSGGGGT